MAEDIQYISGVRLISDEGSGRAVVVLHERGARPELVAQVKIIAAAAGRAIDFELESVSADNWRGLTESLRTQLSAMQVRQASFVAVQSAGAVLQHLCYLDLKAARTVVFIDSSTRPHPSPISRFVDWLERKLPLGLPLRLRSREFDGASFLQRIRCPALAVVSPTASSFERDSGRVLAEGLPTAWLYEASGEVKETAEEIVKFQETPARCPQKRTAPRAA